MTFGAANDVVPIEPLGRAVDADVKVPGSKSHTNRAMICAALATGTSVLDGILLADDTEAMMAAVAAIGAGVEVSGGAAEPAAKVRGLGTDQDAKGVNDQPGSPSDLVRVDVRQSGTTGRFLLAVLAGLDGRFVLDGDEQLRQRPFGPQLDALRAVGAEIVGEQLPLTINGRRAPTSHLSVAGDISSQFLSGLLLAAPLANGTTTIEVSGDLISRPYVELTLSTMRDFGVEVQRQDDLRHFVVPRSTYRAESVAIEPDASAASYFFGLAALTGGRVRVEGLGSETIQGDIKFVEVLERMGCKVSLGPGHTEVVGPDRLQGVDVDMSDISDTVQTLAVVASQAESPTYISGVGFIRNKETDRLSATATELQRLGIDCVEMPDGLVINPGKPRAGVVQTYDDHRMAMSFTMLGLVHRGVEIAQPGCVSKTFPRFFEVIEDLRTNT